MSKVYDNGYIDIDGQEIRYQFERAVWLGQPGTPKEPIAGEGGLVLRGALKPLMALFDTLEAKAELAAGEEHQSDRINHGGLVVQAKAACDCTIDELLNEVVRQGAGNSEVAHVNFNQSRMMQRDDDGKLVIGNLSVKNLTMVTEKKA